VEAAMPSVVAINNTMVLQQQTWFGFSQEYEAKSSGSGIIIGQNDDELLIVTNNHVVEDSKDITVTFIDESQATAAIKGTDSESDLAVIAVPLSDIPEDTMNQIKIATIGDSDALKVGQGVIAIGNALGYGQSVTVGYVSALDREVKTDESTTRNLLQTDAAINPGNSGGALLNMYGEVIGINSAKYSSTSVEGMGYAIPISKAQDIINDLMNKHTRVAVDEKEQGYLGIQGNNIDDAAAQMYGMPKGIYVFKIMDNTAAAASDLHEKDIITKFDGQTVRTMADLKEMLTYYKEGTTVELTVQSLDGGEYKERTVSVTLGKRETAETN
jgi:serine protease Do